MLKPLYTNTPSQRWAKSVGACRNGRRRAGNQSFAQYWRSCTRTEDLRWVALQFKPADPNFQNIYERRVWRVEASGRWAVKHLRDGLVALFEEFNVSMPARLL